MRSRESDPTSAPHAHDPRREAEPQDTRITGTPADRRRDARKRERRRRRRDKAWIESTGQLLVGELLHHGLSTTASILQRALDRALKHDDIRSLPALLASAGQAEAQLVPLRRAAMRDADIRAGGTTLSSHARTDGGEWGYPGEPPRGGEAMPPHSDARAKTPSHLGATPLTASSPAIAEEGGRGLQGALVTDPPPVFREVSVMGEAPALTSLVPTVVVDRDTLFDDRPLFDREVQMLAQGVPSTAQLRAWMDLWGLSLAEAAVLLRSSESSLERWYWFKEKPITGPTGKRLGELMHRDRWEVLRTEMYRPASDGQVKVELEVDRRASAMAMATCHGLDPMELEYFAFWTPLQVAKGNMMRRAREPGKKTVRLVTEMDRLRFFQVMTPAGCAVLHVPTGIVEKSETKPRFWENRNVAERKVSRSLVDFTERDVPRIEAAQGRVGGGAPADLERVAEALEQAIEAKKKERSDG